MFLRCGGYSAVDRSGYYLRPRFHLIDKLRPDPKGQNQVIAYLRSCILFYSLVVP